MNLDDVIGRLEGEASTAGFDVLVRGSGRNDKPRVAGWTDVDITFSSETIGPAQIAAANRIVRDERALQSDYAVSLTLTNTDDHVDATLHHHGVKPLAYTVELARSLGLTIDIPEPVIVIDSVYRYHEILHSMRRSAAQAYHDPQPELIAKNYNRLVRFLRTQMEIMRPDLARQDMIDERDHLEILTMHDDLPRIIERYDAVRTNWPPARSELSEHLDYLITTFDTLHQRFMPTLRTIGEQLYADLR